jgi:hypothetical protein
VLFGFLHPEDLAAELRDALSVDIRITTAIANAINQRIFAPIRTQIDAVYKPVGSGSSLMSSGVGPKILEEIRAVTPVGARPMPGSAFPQVGWSGMPTSGGPRPTSGPSTPTQTPTLMGNVAVLPPKPPTFSNLQKTELGKIVLPPRPEAARDGRAVSAGTGGGAPAPMPVFMGTDTATRPLAKAPDFGMKSIDRIASLTSMPPAPPKPAVIEFGIPKPPVKSPVVPPPTPQLPPRPPGR